MLQLLRNSSNLFFLKGGGNLRNCPFFPSKIDKNKLNAIFKTNVTPTFVFYKNNIEIGRISGYSNPEMFWWQIDEIIEN